MAWWWRNRGRHFCFVAKFGWAQTAMQPAIMGVSAANDECEHCFLALDLKQRRRHDCDSKTPPLTILIGVCWSLASSQSPCNNEGPFELQWIPIHPSVCRSSDTLETSRRLNAISALISSPFKVIQGRVSVINVLSQIPAVRLYLTQPQAFLIRA